MDQAHSDKQRYDAEAHDLVFEEQSVISHQTSTQPKEYDDEGGAFVSSASASGKTECGSYQCTTS